MQPLPSVKDIIINALTKQLPESINFLQQNYNLSRSEAYDICMSTFLIALNKVNENKISTGNIRFLFTRMCINYYIDSQKKKNKVDSAIKAFLQGHDNSINKEAFFDKIDLSIKQLEPDQRDFLAQLYCGSDPKLVAKNLNISYSNLRKRKERLLKKLKFIYFNLNQDSLISS